MDADVILIGAGATGAGLARDLALRGISCILLEKADMNAGASGRNHGLLHSGARYVAVDPHAAVECRKEGAILKRIVPHCVEDCGGLFVALPGDDAAYIREFPERCKAADIDCEPLPVSKARELEPALAENILAACHVPDASIDPFMLVLENIADAVQHGAQFLHHHTVQSFIKKSNSIDGVEVRDTQSGQVKILRAKEYAITAGAWSGEIAALAGCTVNLALSRGTLLVTQTRLTRRVINRLRGPGDGDILVPGGTVSVLGTTSVRVESPTQTAPTIAEVDANLAEAIPLLPVLGKTVFRRAYAGIRPLLTAAGKPGENQKTEEGRKATRDFALLTFQEQGVENLVCLTGGKLTTYRLMAERGADYLAKRLGVKVPCVTAEQTITPSLLAEWSDPSLSHKYAWWNKHNPHDMLLCECEVVPASAIDATLAEWAQLDTDAKNEALQGVNLLPTLSARTRVGKGSCQGTFCGARITAHLYDCNAVAGTEGAEGLKSFLNERWRGQRPVLWGDAVSQAELKEALYFGLMGLQDIAIPTVKEPQ